MPSVNLEYPTQPYSKVNRYGSRASYALETIHQIVNTCPILHVSFTVPNSPFPMILPMIGQMGSFARPSADTGDVLELYLHGYVSSRIMNLSRKADGEGEEHGLPICVAATHLDGLVLSLTPNSHSYNYRSAALFGYATLVTDVEEKLYAMRLITDSVVRDRYRHTRVPPNAAEMQSTSVLRVRITAGSAKIRSGLPKDDRGDMENQEVLDRVWTGVFPVHYTIGEPVPGPYNRVKGLPGYLDEFRTGFNEDSRDGAVQAAMTVEEEGKAKVGDD
ncbi:uncharacterized protein GGS22DRAFT_96288 [Annulohypoxylon maeteangense]|uniref:uncharacterized protein n=1 Tax=Annulohypoxylon maeteangense TaxID=1927788 RepID=UPI0020089EFE|nr:uncharacterized protein GGS22DRAFT_96288 [Annulohypoxylon maeteangense]KAI0888351.1 hypothetical protein GGS22DRAFT_96288 [Annulohypoxylon maeteangense]